MKHIILAMLILAGLAWPVVAAETQSMVLATQGKSTVTEAGQSKRLLTGSVLKVGARVQLEAGAQATLMLLPQGKRFEASGPAVLELSATGWKAESGSLKAAAGPQVALVPTGQNMGHMGGMAVRAPADQSHMESVFENVTFAPVPGKVALRVSFDASVNETVGVEVSEGYASRGWIGNETNVLPVQDGNDYDVSTPTVGKGQVSAAKGRSGLYHYQLELPLSKMPGDRLRVALNPKDSTKGLITRTRLLAAPQEEALRQAAAQYQAWAAKMPNSPEPWVLLMALYDEHDNVEQALNAGQRALKLAPGDLGILTAVARLQMEAGHMQKAQKLFEQVMQLSADVR